MNTKKLLYLETPHENKKDHEVYHLKKQMQSITGFIARNSYTFIPFTPLLYFESFRDKLEPDFDLQELKAFYLNKSDGMLIVANGGIVDPDNVGELNFEMQFCSHNKIPFSVSRMDPSHVLDRLKTLDLKILNKEKIDAHNLLHMPKMR